MIVNIIYDGNVLVLAYVERENDMKKLLMVGGTRYMLPVIEMAHKIDAYVITCDFCPNNIAHKYSDEYCNVSVVDKNAVLKIAQEKEINGIMAFASDPGVVTAAYVAEKMGLPFQCSYESACILQDKGLFRQFLWENGFNCPHFKRYTNIDEPFSDVDFFKWPVIVKPVDSAGSKGVTKVESPDELLDAIEIAIAASFSDSFIVEDFLTFNGFHSSADVFTVNGELKFVTYSDQLFDLQSDNQYAPAMIIWPTTMSIENQNYLTRETQRLMSLLNMKNGIYNVESCVGADGKPYLMEISPRGGGCKIAEIQEMAMGARLIENEVRSALGMPILEFDIHPSDGNWCEMLVHAGRNQIGILEKISVDQFIMDKYVKVMDFCVTAGDEVKCFNGGSTSLGDMVFRFETREQLDQVMARSREWLNIECKR